MKTILQGELDAHLINPDADKRPLLQQSRLQLTRQQRPAKLTTGVWRISQLSLIRYTAPNLSKKISPSDKVSYFFT
ncbi:MAG: hypothetical protein HQM03_19450 [Magnetococcales bacterium]|nr:hypothetical protein [Magnetococcales bacterium]